MPLFPMKFEKGFKVQVASSFPAVDVSLSGSCPAESFGAEIFHAAG
jgi:hypothetical protein